MYALWQEVPKLVHYSLICKPVDMSLYGSGRQFHGNVLMKLLKMLWCMISRSNKGQASSLMFLWMKLLKSFLEFEAKFDKQMLQSKIQYWVMLFQKEAQKFYRFTLFSPQGFQESRLPISKFD